jgi:hypothetical protein
MYFRRKSEMTPTCSCPQNVIVSDFSGDISILKFFAVFRESFNKSVKHNSLACFELEGEGRGRIFWHYGLKWICSASPCQQASVLCVWTGTWQDEAGRTGALAEIPAQCVFAEQKSNVDHFGIEPRCWRLAACFLMQYTF